MRENRPVIELPRLIDVRPGALNDLPQNLKRLNLEGNGILITGKDTLNVAGNKLKDLLMDNQYHVETVIVEEASMKVGYNVVEKIKEVDANFVVAVGGGTKIDIAKYASFESKIPFISVPTIASHDGIASSHSSLTSGKNSKHSVQAHSPLAVIGDVNILSLAPKRYMLSGCSDIISNKTAVLDWRLSNLQTGERVSEYALTLSNLIADTIINSKEKIAKSHKDGTYTVLKGLITSSISMCIAGSSRPASGAEHMISHKLDHFEAGDGLHGEQCGLASILTMFMHGGNWKEIRNTLEYIGAPFKAEQINVSETEMIEAVQGAREMRPDRWTILSKDFSREEIKNMLIETKII